MAGAKKGTALSLLEFVLRPAVRFCLRHSLKIQDILRVLKVVLLDVAREEIERSGLEPTTSRLSVMTGIPRKFVGTISREDLTNEPSGNIITRVIGQWQADRRYLTDGGRPRRLESEGAESEFAALVRSVSVDLNPYTVLFELERVGVIARHGNKVELLSRFYLGSTALEAVEIASEDADDLFRAAQENGTSSNSPPHLHLSTFYDNVPDEAVEKVRTWMLKEGSLFHKRAREFISQFDKDLSQKVKDKPGRNRIRLGAFSFIDRLKR